MRETGDVFGPFRLQLLAVEPLGKRPGEGSPGETISDDGVGPESADTAENVFVEAVDDGTDGDDGGDPDNAAENGKSGAKRIIAKCVEREKDFFADFESAV